MVHRLWRGLVFAGFMVVSAGGRVALGVDGTPSWFFSEVKAPGVGQHTSAPSLAFDHYGTPSVAYTIGNGTSNTIYRSEQSGLGLWSHRTVTNGSNIGLVTALSYDRAERPTLAWINANGSVNVEFDDSGIVTSFAMSANTNPPALSLSHDLADNLRGMYSGIADGSLQHISKSGAVYSSGPLTTLSDLSNITDADLTTDHAGLRHVIAGGDNFMGTQSLLIASEPSFGGPWASAVLATANDILGAAIATNPTDGTVGLAYTTFESASNTSRLFYAEFDGFALETTEVLTSTVAMFQDLDLAFDLSDGRPAIALERSQGLAEELLFAYRDGGSVWQTSLVDGTISIESALGGFEPKPSLAFDDYGTSFPAIAYVDGDGSVEVAFDPPVPEPATALLVLAGMGIVVSQRGRSRGG